MPIPPLTDYFSAQFILKGLSGLPDDVYTNTFYFRNDNFGGTHDEVADQLAADLLEFYNAPPTNVSTPVSIASRLTSSVANPEAEVRVYDLGDPAPRYPKRRQVSLTGMSTSPLPTEVAACLSYVAGENQPRNRGRIFLGPLSTGAVGLVGNKVAVNQNLRESALASALRLINKPVFQWSVWSPTSGAMKPITGAWMDSAVDIQRRRGQSADFRSTIGTYDGQAGTPVPFI